MEENRIYYVGIDHGNHLMKTSNHVFENVVESQAVKRTFHANRLVYDGAFYKIGEKRNSVKDSKLADDDYYLLTLAALAKECQAGSIPNGARVVLGVGLPLKQFATVRKQFVKYLKRGNQPVHFKFEDVAYDFTIENVLAFPQCYAAVADSLDGRIVAIVDKSQVHLGNIGVMKGNIVSQLLNTLKITKGNDDLNLRCAVVRADLKNGKASFPNGVVVNADKFTIVASGDVNLRDDSVSMSVKPFAGKLTDTNIAKALSSLVKLTGTIQNPRIGVDSANAIKTIVGVTTGGPVYLGTQMLLENDGSPCYTALQGTGYESRFPKPDNVVTQTTGDVGKILDDSVGVVKDTTKGILNILSGGVGKRGKTN